MSAASLSATVPARLKRWSKLGTVRLKTHAVLFMTQSFPPETHAGANRAYSMASALADHCDLTVVAPAPSHPSPERYSDAETATIDAHHPFRVIRSGPFRPHAAGYLRRGLLEIGMAAGLMARRLPPADTIIATSPSFFLGPLSFGLSKAKRSRFIWDLRDLTWVYANEGLRRGGERKHLRLGAARVVTAMAEHLLRNSDVVVTSNSGIAVEAGHHRSEDAPTLVAPNGINRVLYDDLAPVAAAEPNGEPIRVTYAGALGYFQALGSLLETAAMMPDVEFTFVGDGTERDHLESDARDLGLTNVRFTGYVERSRLFDLYRESDILFAQLRELDVMAQATFPSKVFEYLATGRPVVYAGAGITADFLHGTGAALIAEPEDPESIRQAIAKLQGDRELRRAMGMRGRDAAAEHIREDIASAVAARDPRLGVTSEPSERDGAHLGALIRAGSQSYFPGDEHDRWLQLLRHVRTPGLMAVQAFCHYRPSESGCPGALNNERRR